ncbi:MAG: VOC family protein [Patescibacteria group bacterium]
MKNIVPHLWFDKEAKEATAFYVSLFSSEGGQAGLSKINSVRTITRTPSGDCDIVSFNLAGEEFMAISLPAATSTAQAGAGPIFKFNPAISMFVVFDNEQEIEAMWNKLIEGPPAVTGTARASGKALMEYQEYPWAKRYGWLQDKYGLSWQLSWSENHQMAQKITPLLMFTQDKSGKAKEAMELYISLFPNSKVDMIMPYEKGEGDTEGFIKHARFTLNGQHFMAMDSSGPHEFVFNEAVSLIVNCETQEEIDHYWSKLSAVPESEQCGWLKDKFGVSWQVVPTAMNKMMATSDKAALDRVTQAFLKMKKFDIAELEKAYEGK